VFRVQALLVGIALVASLASNRKKLVKKVMRMVRNLRKAALPAALTLSSLHVAVTAAPG
jgi:hypothetical protein